MAALNRKSVDLFFTEDGDFSFNETLGDVKNTKEEDYRCIQQSIFLRLENSTQDFGIQSFNGASNGFEILFDQGENIFASLDDFHGEELNSNTLALIKATVSSCLNSDLFLSRIPHVISVIRKSDTAVGIFIALKIRKTLPNGTKSSVVLSYNGMYNTYSKDFRMFSLIGIE